MLRLAHFHIPSRAFWSFRKRNISLTTVIIAAFINFTLPKWSHKNRALTCKVRNLCNYFFSFTYPSVYSLTIVCESHVVNTVCRCYCPVRHKNYFSLCSLGWNVHGVLIDVLYTNVVRSETLCFYVQFLWCNNAGGRWLRRFLFSRYSSMTCLFHSNVLFLSCLKSPRHRRNLQVHIGGSYDKPDLNQCRSGSTLRMQPHCVLLFCLTCAISLHQYTMLSL